MVVPPLANDAVHVWYASLELDGSKIESHRAVLDDAERDRALRFHFQRDAHGYVIAHGVLRRLLAPYIGCSPRELRFGTSRHGKPSLENASIRFSLSHSGAMAAIAIAQNEVGIDIECLRPITEVESLARRYLNESDARLISELSGDVRAAHFLRCWTRKEACLKAQGLGLSGISQTTPTPTASCGEPWQALEIHPGPGYVGAVVVHRNCTAVQEHVWQHDSSLK